MKKLSIIVLGIFFAAVMNAQEAQPDLGELSGYVVHTSASYSKVELSDSSWQNCVVPNKSSEVKNTNTSSSILRCELSGATLKIGDKEYQMNRGTYLGPDSYSSSSIYYLFTQVEVAPGLKDNLRMAVIVKQDGTKTAHLKFDKTNITEQILVN